MIEQEKKAFKDAMNTLAKLYHQPQFDPETLRIWWAKLSQFDFIVIAKAIDNHVNTSEYMPSPADITKHCHKKSVEFTKLPAPRMDREQSKELAENVVHFLNEKAKKIPKNDYKQWARNILANPSKYPAISIKFAKDALRVT